jgi:glutathione S-transferase
LEIHEMSAAYRLFGAESSGYSTKLRSYLRYKNVAFDWRARTAANEAELQTLSRFPTLPVLVTASGVAVHDTTQMMEALELDTPEPSATPADPALGFLNAVFEEYADSWLSKAVYHYRWTRKKDQRLAAQRVVEEYYADAPPDNRKAVEDAAIVRMLDQLRAMQLDGELGGAVEKSFKKFVKLLDDHLRKHLCLFGGRPSLADFSIAGQLIQLMRDPTPSKIIEKDGEFVAKWCEFMADPKPSGPFESLADLEETLLPLVSGDLASAFLPWAAENLEASLAGEEAFDLVLGKETFRLAPLRSSARSFRELRRRFVTAQDTPDLRAFTDAAGATLFLLRPQQAEALRAAQQAMAPARPSDAGEAVPEAMAAMDGETPVATTEETPQEAPRRRRRRKETSAEAEAGSDAGSDIGRGPESDAGDEPSDPAN